MNARCRSLRSPRRLSALLLLPCALCSTGCAPAPQRPVLVERTIPPELVRPCPAEPPLPANFDDDREQAVWLDRAIEAGAECRAAHRALATWALAPWMTEPPR